MPTMMGLLWCKGEEERSVQPEIKETTAGDKSGHAESIKLMFQVEDTMSVQKGPRNIDQKEFGKEVGIRLPKIYSLQLQLMPKKPLDKEESSKKERRRKEVGIRLRLVVFQGWI